MKSKELLIIGALISLFLGIIALGGVTKFTQEKQALSNKPVQPTLQAGQTPVAPPLQVAPASDLQALRAREDKQLSSYGWVDKNAGIVHIPIEQAMDILLDKGFPVRDDAQ